MKLYPLQNPSGLGWLKGFIERSSRMRVQIILDDANVVRLRIDGIDQPLDAVGVVELGAMLGHFDVAPAG
jgi:hypothetical protein